MKITLLYQVSHYSRVKKQRNIKSWDQQNYLVIRGFCYIRPRYNEVPLYIYIHVHVPELDIDFKLKRRCVRIHVHEVCTQNVGLMELNVV